MVAFSFALISATRVCAAGEPLAAPAAEAIPERHPAFEVNVLWPFLGISEMKAILPVFGDRQVRGEVVLGVYLDYAHWLVRPNAGPTALVTALTGYRQFFGYGFHAEAVLATGLRHEEHAPNGGATYDDFYLRLWLAAGWQYEFARMYVNVRPRLGILIDRAPHYDLEKKIVPAADVNLGFRF